VYAQLATLKEHLPTRYAPRRPANARVERTPHLPSTRRSAGCRTHSPSFRSRNGTEKVSGGALGRNTERVPAARIEARSASTIPRARAYLTFSSPVPPPRRTRHRDSVEEFLLGGGANGIAFVEGPRVSVALEGDIAVYFQGDTHRALSDEHESHAHEILAAYRDRSGGPASGSGDGDLGFLSGEFSVVVFDKLAGCVLAARDPNGAEPLFWGTADFGNSLLFSTDAALLDKQCADADAFPAGTVFCSKCGEITGELTVLNVVGDDARESDDDEALDFLVGDDSEPRVGEEIHEIREPSASPKPAPARASDESSGDRHVFGISFGDAAA
jgi:hypothetical protein